MAGLGLYEPADRIAPDRAVPSLLTTARDRSRDGFGARPWTSGIAWNPTSCQQSEAWAQSCDHAVGDSKVRGAPLGTVKVDPLWIYTPLECALTQAVTEDALDTDAEALTEAHTAFHLARALWLGTGYSSGSPTPTLRNSAEEVTPAGPMDLEDAFALLIHEVSECSDGGRATLHVPEVAIPSALGADTGGRLIERRGDIYYGPMDALVSPGPGYPSGISSAGPGGFGPETTANNFKGSAVNELWIYATGTVEYALGAIRQPTDAQARHHVRRNIFESLAERQAIVRFDPCCTFAARVASPVSVVS